MSDNFPKTLEAHNKSGKARASEMEHAIRWHIKVNMDKDPALYTLFNERLQRILDEKATRREAVNGQSFLYPGRNYSISKSIMNP